ncbi:MAG TPA: hypothetical protein P5300_09335, partial [Acidobacteriota bacterium]|nr:hypothetical protein [Acidobacteriota bacterium]
MRRILRSNPFLTLGALGVLLLAALVLTGARPRPFGGGASPKIQAPLSSSFNPLRGEDLAKLPEFRDLLQTHPPVGEVERLTTPPGYQSSSTGGRIIFAHIADGTIAESKTDRDFMQTAITLVNDSENSVAGTLEFYETTDKGVVQPLTLTIGTQTASSFKVSLGKGQMKRLVTSGTGRVKSGWALFGSDQPLAATCSFSRRTTKLGILSDVGVEESIRSTEFTFFADSIGNVNTSVALVNPDKTESASVTFELRDAAGTLKTSAVKTLKPREHLAQYIHELFKNTPGITEFEGSVVVKSDLPLAGITLRNLGALLTSVPMVQARNPRQLVTELDFPQVGDGTYAPSNVRMVSSVIVFNNGESPVSGKVDFIKPDGSAMRVAVGNQTAASFKFILKAGGVYRLWTKGTGKLQTGWARVTAEDGIAGTAIYQFTTPTGNQVVSEVGVSAALGTPINAVADSLADCRTGLALANRSETESNEITLTLCDSNGVQQGSSKKITLAPSAQTALFVDQLFSKVQGINELLGRVLISGAEDTVAFTLRQVGVLTTSVPTVNPVHGFTPNSVLEFTQNLTGTSPAVRWRIDQNGNDLGLNQLTISAPGLGANLNNFPAGSELGYGVFLLKYAPYSAGGVVKLISTGTNPLTFNVVISAENLPQGSVLMSGKITGQSSGNLVIELGPTDAPNGDWNRSFGLELDLLLRDGLIKAPAQAGSANIRTVYTSASQKLTEDGVRIERTTTQPQTFAATAGAPLLTSSRPLYTSPGATLVLQGSKFDSAPTVTFRPDGGSDVPALFPTVVDQGVEVYVPTAAQAGTVKVSKGTSASNQLRTLSLYSPSMTLRKAAGSPANSLKLTLTGTQPPVQLGLATFQLSLLGVSWPPQVGGVGSKVGSFKITGGAQSTGVRRFDVKLESKQLNSMSLTVLEGGSDLTSRITVSKSTEPSSNGVLLSYAPEEST